MYHSQIVTHHINSLLLDISISDLIRLVECCGAND